ncbi:hypothetical protein CASFOL_034435 [Castilleja foliolosa]|uniref:GAG-pre-integrase domain-containing protein n=1 Tax=Castilleja foliolosa TaxID=1961234 RepID=A0ABD3BYP2_9LAMI
MNPSGSDTSGGTSGGDKTPTTITNEELSIQIAQILKSQINNYDRKISTFQNPPHIEPKLNDTNYSMWAQDIKIALVSRGKWHHISGIPEPPKPNEPEFTLWVQHDLQVLSWILESMQTDILGQFIEYPTSRDLWEGILETFRSGDDALQIYELNIQATHLYQGDKTIKKYYQRCQAIWHEIDRRDPYDIWTPADMNKYNTKMQTFRLYQFLHGADAKFDAVKRDFLKETPLPSVEMAYAVLRREAAIIIIINPPTRTDEIEVGLQSARKKQTAANGGKPWQSAKQSNPPHAANQNPDRSTLRCDHCQKMGHMKKGCFDLIGYPDWYDKNPKFIAKGVRRGTAAAASGGESQHIIGSAAEEEAELGFAGRTEQSEYQGNEKRGYNYSVNIGLKLARTADWNGGNWRRRSSGTAAPMEIDGKGGDQTLLSKVKEEENGPNNSKVDIGLSLIKMEFGPNIIKEVNGPSQMDGLATQNFGLSPIVEDDQDFDLFAKLQELNKIGPIDDPSPIEKGKNLLTKKIIGRGIERDELYYIEEMVSHGSSLISTSEKISPMWHCRLGHPSSYYFNILFPKLKVVEHYDSCTLAKSHCKVFRPNITRVSKVFDLVHSDA